MKKQTMVWLSQVDAPLRAVTAADKYMAREQAKACKRKLRAMARKPARKHVRDEQAW